MNALELTRRDFGAMGGLIGAGLGLSRAATAATPKALPTSPQEILAANVRMGGTSGKNRIIYKTRIVVYGVQPTGVRPLVGLRGSESSWWTKKDDDTYIRHSSTLSFWEDLETGKFIEEFDNPYTGKRNKVTPSFIRHKEGLYLTTRGDYYGTMKKAFPDSYPDETPKPQWSLDGDVIRWRGSSKFPPILPMPTLEAGTRFAYASEVFDPKVETPQCVTCGWNIRPWERWMEMGDTPGHVIWHFDGIKLTDVELHDKDYLERARAFTPLYDQNPQFDEGPSHFERVLQNRGVKAS